VSENNNSFEDACELLGGTLKRTGPDTVCEISPHDKATVQIVVTDGALKEVSASNELANTHITYPTPGEKIENIKLRRDKKLVHFTFHSGNSCTFTRLPRIVRGTCVIDSRVVTFAFDP